MGHPDRLAANVWLSRCSRWFISLLCTYGQNHGVGFIYTDSFGNLNDEGSAFLHQDEQDLGDGSRLSRGLACGFSPIEAHGVLGLPQSLVRVGNDFTMTR